MRQSVPDPTKPKDVLYHYFEQFKRLVICKYREIRLNKFNIYPKHRFTALKVFENSGKGKIAIVLANGPSVSTLDQQKLKQFIDTNNVEVFCVNYFPNSDFAKKIPLHYWVISDPRHYDFSEQATIDVFENVSLNLKKGIFLPDNVENKITEYTKLPIIGFNDVQNSNIFSNNINPLFPRSYLSMTAYKALAISLFGNYDKIYICGFDNTFIADLGCDQNNKIYRKAKHFYTKKDAHGEAIFKKDYLMGLGKYDKPRNRNVSQELLTYSRLFSEMDKFKDKRIINLDLNSLTDRFVKDNSLDIYV
jgi:hypothetical protein